MVVQANQCGKRVKKMYRDLVIIRGAGDIASGISHRLHRSGFKVVMLETDSPTVIRRTVSFAEAIFSESTEVEGIIAERANDIKDVWSIICHNKIPVLIDKSCDSIKVLQPFAVVDAILAKRNLGTHLKMAPIVIGCGPGFVAGNDVKAVVETKRGHDLGRVIFSGAAQPNTGVPGVIGGYGKERVMHSPAAGIYKIEKEIGDMVEVGDILGYVGETSVLATLSGVLRGQLKNGLVVPKGLKIADIDPRGNKEHCFSISDKARAIGGGVLEAICFFSNQKYRF